MRGAARRFAIACGAWLALSAGCSGAGRAADANANGPTTTRIHDEPDATLPSGLRDAGASGRCAAHELDCTGVCVDPDTDSNFCGASADCVGPYRGQRCDARERCIAGYCTLVCREGEIDCGGACVDPGAQRCLRWAQPQALAGGELGSAGFPQLAVDAAGNAIALFLALGWNDHGTGLYAVRYDAELARWSAPELLSFAPAAGETASVYTPALGLDRAGNALVVWSQPTKSARIDLWSRRFDAASDVWEPAILVEHDPVDADSAWLAVQPDGDALVIWRRFDDIHATTWWNRYDAARGAWQQEQPAGFALELWSDFGIAFGADDDGNAFAAWPDFDPHETVRLQRFDAAAGAWAEPISLGDRGVVSVEDVSCSVQPSGDALVVWRELGDEGDTLFGLAYDRASDTWSDVLEIARGSPYLDWRALPAFDAAGTAYLAWSEYGEVDSGPVRVARLPARASAWEAPQPVTTTDADVHIDVHVAANAAGAPALLWTTRARNTFAALEFARFDTAEETWSIAQRIDSRTSDRIAAAVLVAGPDGTFFAVWEHRTDSSADVIASVYR